MSKADTQAAIGLPDRIWLVVEPSGERHFLVREPLEGVARWCEGLSATVVEYRLGAVVRTPPSKPQKKEKPK